MHFISIKENWKQSLINQLSEKNQKTLQLFFYSWFVWQVIEKWVMCIYAINVKCNSSVIKDHVKIKIFEKNYFIWFFFRPPESQNHVSLLVTWHYQTSAESSSWVETKYNSDTVRVITPGILYENFKLIKY